MKKTTFDLFSYSFVRAREDEVRKIGRKDASFNLLMRKVLFEFVVYKFLYVAFKYSFGLLSLVINT